MIPFLDNRRRIGIMLMIAGTLLFVSGIVCFFPINPVESISTCVGNVIMGEVMFFTGVGFYRQRPYIHFFHLFDDCESRTGTMYSISAGFGLVYLIEGILSIVVKDSINSIGNIFSGFVLLVAPGIMMHYGGKRISKVAHVLLCIFTTLLFLLSAAASFLFVYETDIAAAFQCAFHTIVLFILTVHLYDREVLNGVWGEKGPILTDS